MKIISLSQGLNAIVDDIDYENILSLGPWYANRIGNIYYAFRNGKGLSGKRRSISIHRIILNAPDGVDVDHIDGNGLNNQRSNLRLCSRKENIRSRHSTRRGSSKFRGVTWEKNRRKWQAQIMVDRRNIFIGRFDSENDAARAYDKAARKYFGTFASPNFFE